MKKNPNPLNSWTVKDILHSYTTCRDYLKERLFEIKIHWLGNKLSNSLNK